MSIFYALVSAGASFFLGFFLGFSILALICEEKKYFQVAVKANDGFLPCSSCSYFRVMLEDGMASCRLGIWVQLEHYPQILQRILLQYSALDLLAAMTASAVFVNVHYHQGRPV